MAANKYPGICGCGVRVARGAGSIVRGAHGAWSVKCGRCAVGSAVSGGAGMGAGHAVARSEFAEPGGRSALGAAGRGNPRNLPCPTCGEANRLTPADRARGYQCDACADRLEGCGW